MFSVGREGDLAIDDNLFLHRHFLTIENVEGLWLLSNVGAALGDRHRLRRPRAGLARARRAPAARLRGDVGDLQRGADDVRADHPRGRADVPRDAAVADDDGLSTIGDVPLTPSQRVMILALAEPVLRREGTGMSELPTSAQAAERLGWTLTRFNRKLDNVCDKLDRIGVPGLRGGARS